MSNMSARAEAVSAIASRKFAYSANTAPDTPTDITFGANTFSLARMKKVLKPETYHAIEQTISQSSKLPDGVADEVAEAMKDWAISRGATHFAHVFYPLTGATAEKHDSFYDPSPDGGASISKFSGKTLLQGEPDASSFPSGGLRTSHAARGYTAWDATSPAYLMENSNGTTLCIPTSFVSWTGEALDTKTPLLKSMQALDKQARRILRVFGHKEVPRVTATAGPEQEYFLIDKMFFYARPDLLSGGRTLFGAPPPKGQEFDDHYFGIIPDRVMAFMQEVDRELVKLGIPTKTRHNEVAPGQFEIAPLYESANLASDHQQTVMIVLKKTADKLGLACLLHEKPFAGVNGSGKHVNWSLGTPIQGNLLDPGDTPHENAQFLVFAAAAIRAVDKFAHLLRATIATAGNDHRLGADEAPPAIVSIYLGDQLADVFEQIKAGGATTSKQKGTLRIGVDTLPELPKDAGDRNRTSSFAFTGNRFEFRAVGANMSIAGPLTAINTIMADSLEYLAGRLEGAEDLNKTIQSVLKEVMDKHGRIIFNGNGYSPEWEIEAAERGLPNHKTVADALPSLLAPEIVELYEKYNVLSETELKSRYVIHCEQYKKHINVEARLAIEIAQTKIFPLAAAYAACLADSVTKLGAAGVATSTATLEKVATLVAHLEKDIAHLQEIRSSAESLEDWTFQVVPATERLRVTVDELETLLPDDQWPLPTYQEMLFIK